MAVVTTNLGVITAYGDAVAAGYTGTKAEWQALMANYATVGQQAAQDAQTASQAAQTATTKAGEASQSATRAENAAASITTPDATLTQAGVAADAKKTGDEISDLKEGLSSVSNEVFTESSVALTFFHGAIRPSNGANNNSDKRIRTASADSGYDPISGIFTAEDGVKYSIRFYAQSNGSYVGGDDIFRTGSTDVEAVAEASYPTAKYVRFVIAYSDDRNVSSDEAMAELGAKVTYKKTVGKATALESDVIDLKENTVRKFSVAPTNSLLGNISIRAAKTINFSDGTPPHIDWYLIHDLDYNFYRTKDFVTKEFLFHITPPIGGVANWSCGIDGNNNVFFLRDAASYVASDGPDLDDAKRTNPVYFLASEGYSTMHTLDFGTGLKPAGWLGNVGWCVLPNNDIILCEYTRGTLGTCNVWHVDGTDTTDPSNWDAVWSHVIIDSMNPADPGMKHCHDVQYDFYTGICYFGTGDSDDGSLIYYSTDNGLTWTLAWGPDRTKCRQLNFVFTEDKVYWASDSYQSTYHNFFVAERDANGVIDGANATAISLGQVNSQSCYGCSYLKQLGLVVMMDRNDLNNYSKIDLQGYDIASNTIVNLGTIKEAVNGGCSGFRTKFVDWYPTQNFITVGFNSSAGAVNPDSNALAVCGNLGGSTGNGSTRINNLVMYVDKIGTGYALRFDTHYC